MDEANDLYLSLGQRQPASMMQWHDFVVQIQTTHDGTALPGVSATSPALGGQWQ